MVFLPMFFTFRPCNGYKGLSSATDLHCGPVAAGLAGSDNSVNEVCQKEITAVFCAPVPAGGFSVGAFSAGLCAPRSAGPLPRDPPVGFGGFVVRVRLCG